MPPRERLRLARGSHGLATPTPAPPIEAFNVLTRAGAQVKDESAPYRPSNTAWESYPSVVSPTLPVRAPATVQHCAVRLASTS
jgi:hypothetical protein